jgi:hypothetical protein
VGVEGERKNIITQFGSPAVGIADAHNLRRIPMTWEGRKFSAALIGALARQPGEKCEMREELRRAN